jgi:hypothetical protein
MWSQKVGWHLLHSVSQMSLESVMMTSFPTMTEFLPVVALAVPSVELPSLLGSPD